MVALADLGGAGFFTALTTGALAGNVLGSVGTLILLVSCAIDRFPIPSSDFLFSPLLWSGDIGKNISPVPAFSSESSSSFSFSSELAMSSIFWVVYEMLLRLGRAGVRFS